jgi:hypothetical protein
MLTCCSLGINHFFKVIKKISASYLNISVYYMNTNESLNLVMLAALVGAGGGPWWSSVHQVLPSSIVGRGK